jgi:hypothetical protein
VREDGEVVFPTPSETTNDRVTSRHAFLFIFLSFLTLALGLALFWLLPQTEIMPSSAAIAIGTAGSIIFLGVAMVWAVRGLARVSVRTHEAGDRALRPLGMALAISLMVAIVGACLVNSLLVILMSTNTYP